MNQETQLITALKNNSQKAFNAIYDLYAPRLYAFGMQYAKRREVAEELVEDTFVWLWQNRHHIRQENTLRPLLFIRMRHFLVNAYRATLNTPQYADYVDYVEHLPDNVTTQPIEYDEFLNHVKNAINHLPPTQRQVIQLSRFSQLSNKEIAQQLGLAEQTVKNQLSLALKTLRQTLNPTLYGLLLLFFNVNS